MSTELARKLRRQAGEPERAMWCILHSLRRKGYNFRRQALIGSYYVDFVCRQPGLVIEVDGETHTAGFARSNDDTRDDYLRGRGFKVLRFWNNEVMDNPDGVFTVIGAALAELTERGAPPTLDPSPQRGRESTEAPAPIEQSSPSPLRGGIKGGGRRALDPAADTR